MAVAGQVLSGMISHTMLFAVRLCSGRALERLHAELERTVSAVAGRLGAVRCGAEDGAAAMRKHHGPFANFRAGVLPSGQGGGGGQASGSSAWIHQ